MSAGPSPQRPSPTLDGASPGAAVPPATEPASVATGVVTASGPSTAHGTSPSTARVAMVVDVILSALATGRSADGATLSALADGASAPRVLDCGGGSGAVAVPLAVNGCDVTVVDISADALATLRRRADEAGVGDAVRAVNADLDRLADLVPGLLSALPTAPPGDGSVGFDMVLAHGILDAVDDPATATDAVLAAVRPGGAASFVLTNPVAGVVARALAGQPREALAALADLDRGPSPSSPASVQARCVGAGFDIEDRRGIGVFADVVPGGALDGQGERDALARLDAAVADRAPFADIASRVQLIVRRPPAG